MDLVLDPGVDRRGRIVQDQQPGVGEDGAGEGDALALAAGQGQPLLADLGVIALGELGYEAVRLGGAAAARTCSSVASGWP